MFQHPVIDFPRFNPLCLQKMHYSALFHSGTIAERSGHTSTLIAVCHVLNDGILHAASYRPSLAHVVLHVSATFLFLLRNFKIAFTF
jgi:hypothetical protein